MVYFISIGYAFSIVAMAVAVMIVLRQNLVWASLLHNLLLMIWGLRLGLYLVRREMKPSYGNELAATHQRTAGMSLGLKVVIWAGVSFLYVLMFLREPGQCDGGAGRVRNVAFDWSHPVDRSGHHGRRLSHGNRGR